jgi:hypothetical protein
MHQPGIDIIRESRSDGFGRILAFSEHHVRLFELNLSFVRVFVPSCWNTLGLN